MAKKKKRDPLPPCKCGVQATCMTFSLINPKEDRYECRPCQSEREARECGACSGRGKWRDGVTVCERCQGTGLRPKEPA